MAEKKIALFIDADNISAKFGKQIIETLESRGEIFIRRIYGNWEKNSLHSWNECILNFSLRAIQQPDYVAGKNATDMSLAIDAMDVLYGGKAEAFALISNDSDFTPLAIRLREGGMKIIGMGNANAANSFRMACDEFIDLDASAKVEIPATQKENISPEKNSAVQMNLFATEKKIEMAKIQPVKKIPAPVAASPKVVPISGDNLQCERSKRFQQLHKLLRDAAETHHDETGFVNLSYAGSGTGKKKLGFGIKDLGYSSLKSFVADFPSFYEVRKVDKAIYYRCQANEPRAVADKIQRLHDIMREIAKIYGDEYGFFLLNSADIELRNRKIEFGVKNFGYNTLQEFVMAFPKVYEVQRTSGVTRYRCRPNISKSSVERRLQQIHKVLRETAKSQSDEKGFVSLVNAGTAIAQKKLSIKGSGHNKLNKFISAFPELYEVQYSKQGFSYRCKK